MLVFIKVLNENKSLLRNTRNCQQTKQVVSVSILNALQGNFSYKLN